MKQVELSHGIKVTTFEQPPSGFNPLTAQPSDLARYGFPAMVPDEHHKQRYQKVMQQLSGKFNYVQPTFQVREDRFHGPHKASVAGRNGVGRRTGETAAGTETDTNWAGGVIFAPAGDSFKWLEGDWVVPNVGAPTQNQWYYSASWIGIDGDASGDVCQAGVECEVYQSGASISRNIYPWWEWYPLPEVQISNFAANPGDLLTMILCTAKGAGSTTATVYLTNRTSGASTSFGFNAPAGTTLVGNCAEWIVEAPTVSGAQSSIADYGEVFFSVCEAVTEKGTTLYGGTGDNINMVAGGQVVSAGNLITPTVVQCWYEGALP